jgi:hypothetical protein
MASKTIKATELKEITDAVVSALGELDRAITPRGSGSTFVAGNHDASGGYVASLTEAVMGVTAGLCRIADAIDGLSSAVRVTGVRNDDEDE